MTVLPLKVKTKYLTSECRLPEYSKPGDSGADLRFNAAGIQHMDIWHGQTELVPTGLAFELPPGFELQVRPRSGLSSKGLHVHLGTIDNCYRGEVRVIVTNLNAYGFIRLERGDRVAQLVLAPVVRASFEVVDELSESERGTGAFGSSGVR